jgi:formylglycine-generating enzyme required for sulfatase activity
MMLRTLVSSCPVIGSAMPSLSKPIAKMIMNTRHLVLATCLSIQPLAILFAADPAPLAAKETSFFAPTIANPSKPPSPAPEGMVWIPGCEFSMGSEGKCDGKSCCSPATVADALPIHRVYVDGFWMDATDVTNAQFDALVSRGKAVAPRKRIQLGPKPGKDSDEIGYYVTSVG